MGVAAALSPQTALALSLDDVANVVFSSPYSAFGFGAAGGAAVAVAVCAGVGAIASHARHAREAEELKIAGGFGYEKIDFPQVMELDDEPETSAYTSRHMKVAAPAPQAAAASQPATAPASKPTATPAPAPARSHAATDYEQIAANYVGRATFRERMSNRAQGVASVLRARLEAGMMDGLPVIERADGSVGDVGTGWWTASVGVDAMTANKGYAEDTDAFAIPSDFSAASDRELLVEAAAKKDTRNKNIAQRVAFVDDGVYPEKRTVEDLSASDDGWVEALRSMDARYDAEHATPALVTSNDSGVMPVKAAFSDLVGGIDSLDEPDNMEPATSFIHFKTPAGHPEVVDAETYVDYLIEDEFRNNSSNAVRRSAAGFLRMLEGGTQPTSTSALASARHTKTTSSLHVGKHFAYSQAAEA